MGFGGGGGGGAVAIVPKTGLRYGNGADGDVTISSNTDITRDMYYDNLIIDATNHLNTNGYIVFCKTSAVINGSIGMNGNPGVGNSAGADTNTTKLGIGRQGGAFGANGQTTAPSLGGNGGDGGSGSGSVGTGAVTVPPTAQEGGINQLTRPFGIYTGKDILDSKINGGAGGGGGGSSTGDGGGGGGGGGVTILVARDISGTGSIRALGGDGGLGVNDSGGGGGGGGGVIITVSDNVHTVTTSPWGGTGGEAEGFVAQDGDAGSQGNVYKLGAA